MATSDLWESYRLLVDDINRYRNLPIQVFTFTAALHFAIIAAIAVKGARVTDDAGFWLTLLLGALYAFTLFFFRQCHIKYLELRNIQVRLNGVLNLKDVKHSGEPVFPNAWFEERPVSWREGFWGWGFFAAYATVLFAVSLMVIWNCGIKWK